MKTTLALTDAQMIGLLGGAKKVAVLFKIDQAAVNQWKVNGIPLNRLVFLAAEIEKKQPPRKRMAILLKKGNRAAHFLLTILSRLIFRLTYIDL